MKTGTSSLVVAAFVGPGTVLTCAAAGVRFGYELGWVLLFATAAVFVLQSLTAGTGLLAGKGLGEALRGAVSDRLTRVVMSVLVVAGLWIGSAAFESGNLVGASAGISTALGAEISRPVLVLSLAAAAAVILLLDMRQVVRIFSALVILMSVLFLATMLIVPLDWSSALRGLFIPTIPTDALVTVVALLGTTIVTYNLFLHPAAAKAYWAGTPPKSAWRGELRGMAIFLPIGGLVSFAIVASGAALPGDGRAVADVAEFARLLEPAAGEAARYLFGLGLFAAGLTSAVTAPMAAAAGISGLFGWKPDEGRYRAVWGSTLAAGVLFALSDLSPLTIIIAAQAANGILLPLIAGFIVVVTFRQPAVSLSRWYFAAAVVIVAICAVLGLRTVSWAWNAASSGL